MVAVTITSAATPVANTNNMEANKPEWFANHEQSDLMQFQAIHAAIADLPTKKDLEPLATKKDIQEALTFYNNIQFAGKLISGGGIWSWRIIMGIATLITVVG